MPKSKTVLGLEYCCNHDGPRNMREARVSVFYWTNRIVGKDIRQAFRDKVSFFRSDKMHYTITTLYESQYKCLKNNISGQLLDSFH